MNKKTFFIGLLVTSCLLLFFVLHKKAIIRFVRKTLFALDYNVRSDCVNNYGPAVTGSENKIQITSAVIKMDDLTITADTVFLDYKTNDAEFVGNVCIKQDDMVLTGTQFFYDNKLGLLYSNCAIKLETSLAVVAANAVRFDKKSKEIIFDHGVHTRIDRQD